MSLAGVAKQPRPTWHPLEIGALAVLTAAVAMVLFSQDGAGVGATMTTGGVAVLSALAWQDIRERRIPNRIVYPALVGALVVSPLWPDRSILSGLLGGGIALALMLPVCLLARGGLGAGDVKIAALVGMVVGADEVLLALLVAASSCGLVAVTLRRGRAGLTARAPFGLFLALGAIFSMLH